MADISKIEVNVNGVIETRNIKDTTARININALENNKEDAGKVTLSGVTKDVGDHKFVTKALVLTPGTGSPVTYNILVDDPSATSGGYNVLTHN